MTQGTFVREGVSISLGEFAVVELSAYKLKEGSAVPGNGVDPFVNGLAHCL